MTTTSATRRRHSLPQSHPHPLGCPEPMPKLHGDRARRLPIRRPISTSLPHNMPVRTRRPPLKTAQRCTESRALHLRWMHPPRLLLRPARDRWKWKDLHLRRISRFGVEELLVLEISGLQFYHGAFGISHGQRSMFDGAWPMKGGLSESVWPLGNFVHFSVFHLRPI